MKIGRPESQKEFKVAPDGSKSVVLCDVVDLGEVKTNWGPKDMIRFHYLTEDTFVNDEGDELHYMVVERVSKSLYDGSGKSPNPSKLYKRVKALTGKAPQYDADGLFDVEALIGCGGLANLVLNEKDGKTYCNIDSIMPLPKGVDPVAIPADFKRKKDREDNPDDIPF